MYHIHVVRMAANGVWRSNLKFVNNKKKIAVIHDKENMAWMAAQWFKDDLRVTCLQWLQDTNYSQIDHGLCFVFVERRY
uniref:Uncharacterized protein n=1 Tax=Medicago truncatula TaxID=3880 RepID=A2Q3N5_MEDTR|nr:hypothetical protein MtrDRAFT_AC155886g13v2 [Medicago truncatula]